MIIVNLRWIQWDYAHPSVSFVLGKESVCLAWDAITPLFL